jgi:hypothetical protein
LLQRTADPKTHKERMHLDLERGYDFWVLATLAKRVLRPADQTSQSCSANGRACPRSAAAAPPGVPSN